MSNFSLLVHPLLILAVVLVLVVVVVVVTGARLSLEFDNSEHIAAPLFCSHSSYSFSAKLVYLFLPGCMCVVVNFVDGQSNIWTWILKIVLFLIQYLIFI